MSSEALERRRAQRLAEQLRDNIAQARAVDADAQTIRQHMVIDEIEALLADVARLDEARELLADARQDADGSSFIKDMAEAKCRRTEAALAVARERAEKAEQERDEAHANTNEGLQWLRDDIAVKVETIAALEAALAVAREREQHAVEALTLNRGSCTYCDAGIERTPVPPDARDYYGRPDAEHDAEAINGSLDRIREVAPGLASPYEHSMWCGLSDAQAAARAALADELAADDPLDGANCALCGATADNFHVPDELWERVGLGDVQACFRCFRIAAWHRGVRPDPGWLVDEPAADESLTEEGGVNESSSGVHGQQMSPLPSPENDRSGRSSASTSPPAVSDSPAAATLAEPEAGRGYEAADPAKAEGTIPLRPASSGSASAAADEQLNRIADRIIADHGATLRKLAEDD